MMDDNKLPAGTQDAYTRMLAHRTNYATFIGDYRTAAYDGAVDDPLDPEFDDESDADDDVDNY